MRVKKHIPLINMTSTTTNRQTRRNSISAQASNSQPNLVSLGFARMTDEPAAAAPLPFRTQRPLRRLRRLTAEETQPRQQPTLDEMGGGYSNDLIKELRGNSFFNLYLYMVAITNHIASSVRCHNRYHKSHR